MRVQFIGGAGVDDGAATLVVGQTSMISALAMDDNDQPVQSSEVTYAWTWPDWLPTYPDGYEWPTDAQQTQFKPTDNLVGRIAEVGVTITTYDGRKLSKSLKCTIVE